MGTTLSDLKPAPGSRRKRKRLGRGNASGRGGTSGKGHKGQLARTGGTIPTGFEGGQMPLQRRLPKRGFKNPFRTVYEVVNLRDLAGFDAGTTIDAETLRVAGRIPRSPNGLKVLAVGDLDRALTLKVAAISAKAREKVEAAGGSVEIVPARAAAKADGAGGSGEAPQGE